MHRVVEHGFAAEQPADAHPVQPTDQPSVLVPRLHRVGPAVVVQFGVAVDDRRVDPATRSKAWSTVVVRCLVVLRRLEERLRRSKGRTPRRCGDHHAVAPRYSRGASSPSGMGKTPSCRAASTRCGPSTPVRHSRSESGHCSGSPKRSMPSSLGRASPGRTARHDAIGGRSCAEIRASPHPIMVQATPALSHHVAATVIGRGRRAVFAQLRHAGCGRR